MILRRLTLLGEQSKPRHIVGRAVADASRARLGTTGALLFAGTFLLLAIPLATQVSLAETFLGLRVRLAGFWSRFNVSWVRSRDRKTKERLRRNVVSKHLEKARREGISLEEVPFAAEDPPFLREVPGPGKFSLTKTVSPGKKAETAAASPPKKVDSQIG